MHHSPSVRLHKRCLMALEIPSLAARESRAFSCGLARNYNKFFDFLWDDQKSVIYDEIVNAPHFFGETISPLFLSLTKTSERMSRPLYGN